MEFFLCNKYKVGIEPNLHQISAASKTFWENFKITDHQYWFWILKNIVFLAVIGYLKNYQATIEQLRAPKTLKISESLRDDAWP